MTLDPYFLTYHCKDRCSYQQIHPLSFESCKIPNEIPLLVADLEAISKNLEDFSGRYICLPIGYRKFRQYLNYCPNKKDPFSPLKRGAYLHQKPIVKGSAYNEYFGTFMFVLDKKDLKTCQFGIMRLQSGLESQLPMFSTLLSCEKQLCFDLLPIINPPCTISPTKLYAFLHGEGDSFQRAATFFDRFTVDTPSLVFSQARVKIGNHNNRLGVHYKEKNFLSFEERTAISEYARLICEHIYKLTIIPFFPVNQPFRVLFEQVGRVPHEGLRNWFDSFSITLLVDDREYIRKAAKVFAQTNQERHQS